jgi:tetratricopeptide (TPR) repeat protein
MSLLQQQYDEAMFAYGAGDFGGAIARLKALLACEPNHFEAQLALGMAYYRGGDAAAAIAEGLRAAQLRPDEQLVHTNLSLFYQKAGDKLAAERHGLQARIAAWREEAQQTKAGGAPPPADPELQLARPKPAPVKFPSMPWKKKTSVASATGDSAAADAP